MPMWQAISRRKVHCSYWKYSELVLPTSVSEDFENEGTERVLRNLMKKQLEKYRKGEYISDNTTIKGETLWRVYSTTTIF